MAWVESASSCFQCRHSSGAAQDAARVLALLEQTREQLAQRYPRTADGLTVVLHDTPASLALSNPLMAAHWAIAGPLCRRYVAGWVGTTELHTLAPAALRRRASTLSGSYELLARAPASLYAQRVIVDCNLELQRTRTAARTLLGLRWAWLIEGASRWLAGEPAHARAAVGRRIWEGRRPRFPPGPRDAPLLGPTLIDLLARDQGDSAVTRLTGRLHPHGPRAALIKAFAGRTLAAVENDWRSELRRLAEGR